MQLYIYTSSVAVVVVGDASALVAVSALESRTGRRWWLVLLSSLATQTLVVVVLIVVVVSWVSFHTIYYVYMLKFDTSMVFGQTNINFCLLFCAKGLKYCLIYIIIMLYLQGGTHIWYSRRFVNY